MSKSVKAISAVAAFVTIALMASGANASGWANGYADYYQNDRTGAKDNNVVIGIEGGKTTALNEMYGFAEYDATNQSTFIKGSNHFKILPKGFSVYTHMTNFQNQFGGETVTVAGVGYTDLKGSDWSFTPYMGYAIKDGSFAGNDTYIAGWSASWKPGDVLFTNWTDVEINQDTGFNGAFGAWVDLTKSIYTGVQYSYSYRMVGEENYGDSVGVRIGMHF